MFGGKSGGTLTLELVRGPALLGEVEVVRHTMLGVPRDEDGRIRRCVSATVGGSSAATIAMFNWHLFNNVVCQNAVRGCSCARASGVVTLTVVCTVGNWCRTLRRSGV